MKKKELIQIIAKEKSRELFLCAEELTSLPPEIGNLTCLKELDLAENDLTSLPPEIGNLTCLKELDIK